MNPEIEKAKSAILREHAKTIQEQRGIGFSAAWSIASIEHPDLTEEFPTEEPAPAQDEIEKGKAARIKELVAQLRKQHSAWSYEKLFGKVLALNPDLATPTYPISSSREEDDETLMLVYASGNPIKR